MPDWSDCMSTAPSIAPAMVPTPPASEVPPMTAAAMTRSSASVPSEFVAALRRAIDIAPLNGGQKPHQHEDLHDHPAGIDAGEHGRFRVAADGIDVAAEAGSRREKGHHHADADRDENRDGDAMRDE